MMLDYRRVLCVFLAVVFFLGPDFADWVIHSAHAQPIDPPRTSQSLSGLVDSLMSEVSDPTDTDLDGLPDSIEIVIGTDPNNADSDFDRLEDLWETDNDLDPLEPDSNYDGLGDYLEVTNVASLDVDGDGLANAWDFDNDGDGVNDGVDLSPFSKTSVQGDFHFEIATNANPLFVTFQLKPAESEHLKLFGQSWDWPDNDRKGSFKDLDNSKEDIAVFPLLDLTVNVPPDQQDVIFNGILVDANSIKIPLLPVFDNGDIAAFTGKMPYPSSAPPNLTMDLNLIWKVVGKNDPNSSLLGQETLLITYEEDFMITGLSIEESYGTDVGLLYSHDVNQTIAANLLLAYEFLRNSENHISDVAEVLNNYNVNVDHQAGSFAHREAALVSIANEMTPDALDSLPVDESMPVVTLIEDRTARVEMSDLVQGPGAENSFIADATQEAVIITKTMKTPWYNTSDYIPLLTKDVMVEIRKMELGELASYSLMSLMLYWNTGEQKLEGLGAPPNDLPQDFDIVPELLEDIAGGGLVALEILTSARDGFKGLQAYRSIRLLQSKGWSVSLGGKAIGDIAKMGNLKKFKLWIKLSDRVQNKVGFMKNMDDVLEGLDAIALAVDAGFAVYSIIAISQSDLSGMALNNALLRTTMEYYYSATLFLIGAIPFVGWLISLAIELSDIFGDWSGEFINWLIGEMSNVNHTVTPGIEVIGDPVITVYDNDENGFDVGDRIEYKSRLKGTIQGTAHTWDLVGSSEIIPYYTISAPPGSSSTVDYLNSSVFVTPFGNIPLPIPPYSAWTRIRDSQNGFKSDEYEAGGWIEPGLAMPNFPVNIRTDYFYETWYEWEHLVILIFYAFWCQHDSRQYDIKTGKSFTFYFDVLPATIDDFVSWRGITSLDKDMDGLRDNQETHSSAWKYDTDADGLNDKYEIERGTDPARHDTDGDGLIDWFELHYNTDPNNADTDGDGLADYPEVAGWLIEFSFGPGEQLFTLRVHSDPTIPDSDSDGVNDYMEYKSGLNPRSQDTNGDGIKDVANPRTDATYLNFEKDFVLPYQIDDITTDANDNLYLLTYEDVLKYDSDLNHITDWPVQVIPCDSYCIPKSIAVDDNTGYVYVAFSADSWEPRSGIVTFYPDGTPVENDLWALEYGDYYRRPMELDIDTDGNLYLLRRSRQVVAVDDPVWPGNDYVDHEFAEIEIYDTNRDLVDSWGSCGDIETWSYPASRSYGWTFVFDVDQFNDVKDLAVDTENGFIYVSEAGLYEENHVWSVDDFNYIQYLTKLKDDRVAKYDLDGDYFRDLRVFLDPNGPIEFSGPWGIDVDSNGYLYVADDNYIYKFDDNMQPIAAWGIPSWSQHSYCGHKGHELAVDSEGNVYAYSCYFSGMEQRFGLIEKYSQSIEPSPPIQDPNPDRDGDGLLNEEETAGWDVIFTDPNGEHTIHVTSDPLLPDTDLDGLADPNEYAMGTNPRDPDTDNDGLSDYAERRAFSPQTNPRHFDSDGDGLPDGIEITYGSNPNSSDSDDDGLSDVEEFEFTSDPKKADTDGDGLNDSQEKMFKSSLLSPDSDGDFMFDGREYELGTDPNNPDTDNDGLSDGIETTYGTNPLNSDTDGDDVPDGTELDLFLNPLSEDTDGDGIPDGTELERGTNPLNRDSDQDGIPDNEDTDSDEPHVENLVLAYDGSQEATQFADGLAEYTTVEIVSASELLSQYSDAPRIVLVGRPDGAEPVGTLINDLLADTGDVLTNMIESDEDRLAVRYGVWNSTQTIVMLSSPYPSDHLRVLDILRKKTVTILPDSAKVEYHLSSAVAYPSGGSTEHGELAYDFFILDEIDTVKQTDSMVYATLAESVNPTVEMSRYDNTTVPFSLSQSSGLENYEIAIGKYLDITLSENVQNQTGDIIDEASIRIYYKESDLDRTGDGIADDPEDIYETTLGMYYFNELAGQWTKLSTDMDWVSEIGADTTDVQLYGNSYAGYVWASVSHLSLYGLAGQTFIEPLETSVHITPQAINRDNHLKRVMAIMQVPEEISRNDIAGGSFELYVNGLDGEHIEAIRHRVSGGGNGVRVFAFFDKDEIMDVVEHNGRVELTVVGRLESGQYIYGSDTVRIIQRKWRPWRKWF